MCECVWLCVGSCDCGCGVLPKEKVQKSINVRKRQFVATSEKQSVRSQMEQPTGKDFFGNMKQVILFEFIFNILFNKA